MKGGFSMSKILVAYFTHSGNTKVVAETIQATAGGDLFQIKTVKPYPAEYNAVVDVAEKEQQANSRPELATKVEDMGSYDIVFVGYPNWWGTIPMGVWGFLPFWRDTTSPVKQSSPSAPMGEALWAEARGTLRDFAPSPPFWMAWQSAAAAFETPKAACLHGCVNWELQNRWLYGKEYNI